MVGGRAPCGPGQESDLLPQGIHGSGSSSSSQRNVPVCQGFQRRRSRCCRTDAHPWWGREALQEHPGQHHDVVVLSGQVKVTIHNATFVAKRHDQFMVPRGNQYRLYNEEAEECRLFFAHAREVVADQVHE